MLTRLVARLDVKGPNLIKSIQFEGLRVLGDPAEAARRYYADGIDEVLYVDPVATLYGRNSLHDVVRATVRDVFVPITVTGGLRSVGDVREMLRAGADKVGINTAAIDRPELLDEVAGEFGSQSVVLSIEAKRQTDGSWRCYTDNGRIPTERRPDEWAAEAVERGAGEVLVTSVDREGTRRGFDCDLVGSVRSVVGVPVVASGGMGEPPDVAAVVDAGADAVAMADALHYGRWTIPALRREAEALGVRTRG